MGFSGNFLGPERRGPVFLLTRHFFRQFFRSDLPTPQAGTEVTLTHVLALLMVPGIFISVSLARKYAFLLAHFPLSVHFDNPLYFILFNAFAIPALFVTVMYRNRPWNSDPAIVYLETAKPAVRTLKLSG